MPQFQTPDRYCSLDKLLMLLRETFPDEGNFRIKEVHGIDGVFSYSAPFELTQVSSSCSCGTVEGATNSIRTN